jgi:phospholipase C
VYGPNGFFRSFKGGITGRRRARLDVRAAYDTDANAITLEISNQADQTADIGIFNKYSRNRAGQILRPGESATKRWSLKNVWGWYDFVITVDGDSGFEYRVAGHVETGDDSISDPLMGGLV